MKYEMLLKAWCDGLIERQIVDAYDKNMNGGFLCPACKTVHGRGDNAIYAFYYMFDRTGEEKYRKAAELCFDFQENFICDDGGLYNDANVTWKAITVFSAISYLKTLENFSEHIRDKEKFEKRTLNMVNWVYNNLTLNFYSNINYQCATSLCMALAGKYFSCSNFTKRAEEILLYCVNNFTENGILYGEGHPHNITSKKGCKAIDIGYNVEESVPALAECAVVLNDKNKIKFFADVLKKQLIFMLPDGAWDNSFTCRNYKWTYFGSRTSDGAAGIYMLYSKYDKCFEAAAKRNLDLMGKCTFDGLLYGGPHYKKAGEMPCVHHTFTHVIALTDALLLGLSEADGEIPSDDFTPYVKYFPELDSYKICSGNFIADFSGYDINRNLFMGGTAYATGGALSLLYHKEKGIITASSIFSYRLAESNNQQLPLNLERHSNLTPRAEIIKDGTVYATCLDDAAVVEIKGDLIKVKTLFASLKNDKLNEAILTYTFNENGVKISVESDTEFNYILPIIADCKVVSDNEYELKEIFNLVPGFTATQCTFKSFKNKVEIEIRV